MTLDSICKKYLKEDFTSTAPGDIGSNDYELMKEVVRAEEDTVVLYTDLANRAQNEKVKAALLSVLNEERVHCYEMQVLMKELRSDHEKDLYKQAEKENKELSEVDKLIRKYSR